MNKQQEETPFVIKDTTNSCVTISNIFMQMKWKHLSGKLMFFILLIWLIPFYLLLGALSMLDSLLYLLTGGKITYGATRLLTTVGYLGTFPYVTYYIERNKCLRWLTVVFWFLAVSPAFLVAVGLTLNAYK